MSKIFGSVLVVLKWALILYVVIKLSVSIAIHSGLFAWWFFGDQVKPVVPAVPPVVVESIPLVNESKSCGCESGSYCDGPRGGQYCFTIEGKKRYRPNL